MNTEKIPLIHIQNRHCMGIISPYGAHILSYRKAGGDELLFVSKNSRFEVGKPIRGGIPVCFPYFGEVAEPMHGPARLQFWNLLEQTRESDDSDTLVFELILTSPHPLRAVFKVNFGLALTMSLTGENLGDTPFTMSNGLHTYFKVGDIRKVIVRGLDGAYYEDTAVNPPVSGLLRKGDIIFDREIDDCYDSTAPVEIIDHSLGRKILIEKSGSAETFIWNPGTIKYFKSRISLPKNICKCSAPNPSIRIAAQ